MYPYIERFRSFTPFLTLIYVRYVSTRYRYFTLKKITGTGPCKVRPEAGFERLHPVSFFDHGIMKEPRLRASLCKKRPCCEIPFLYSPK
jgi:hypothetical protein